jgi:glutaredoxin 3
VKKVTIYSTPTCPYCRMTKEYLKDKKVEFTDYNVAEDQEKAEEANKKSGQMAVPVIVIDGDKEEKIIVGFAKEELDKALGL